jgi:hypothetical protein
MQQLLGQRWLVSMQVADMLHTQQCSPRCPQLSTPSDKDPVLARNESA